MQVQSFSAATPSQVTLGSHQGMPMDIPEADTTTSYQPDKNPSAIQNPTTKPLVSPFKPQSIHHGLLPSLSKNNYLYPSIIHQSHHPILTHMENTHHPRKLSIETPKGSDSLAEKISTSATLSVNQPTVDCLICEDSAINHFHYGGICCYSCKAFFQRIVNSRKATKYKCRSGKNSCDISLANRRSCQACRYNKCLAAGMKPDFVLSEDQRQKRFQIRKGRTDKSLKNINRDDDLDGNEEIFILEQSLKNRDDGKCNRLTEDHGVTKNIEINRPRNNDEMIKCKAMVYPTVISSKNNLTGKQLLFSLFCSSYSRSSNIMIHGCEGDRTSKEVASGVHEVNTTSLSPPCSPPPATPHSQFFQPESKDTHLSPRPLLIPQRTSHLHHPILKQISHNNHFAQPILCVPTRSIPLHPVLSPVPARTRDYQPIFKCSAVKSTAEKLKKKCQSKQESHVTVNDLEEQSIPSKNTTTNQPTVDCPVCGDAAINHFHYGGICCYSCKAFFRRIVNSRKATKYKCRSGKNSCDISLANRRSCQSCRYNKCLAAGLKQEYVLSEDQRQKRFRVRKGSLGMSPQSI